MVKNYSTKNFTNEINVDTDSRIISGYAAAFNNIDSDGDLIVKGAFTKSLNENGVDSLKPRIFHLYQHNVAEVLGRPTVLKEDDYGLYFETKIANTALGNDVLNLYKEGVLNEHSIGFKTIKAANRGSYNEIQEVKLFEFSTVTFGANANTPFLGFKSQFENPEEITQQFDKVEKMLKGEITPETTALLSIYLQQLKTTFLELSTKSVEAINPLEDSLSEVNPIDEAKEIEAKKAQDVELIKALMRGYKTA
ncbi:MAG: HK97 family phage prohead protease [Flavobacterium sp.]|nr:MAG: HK97 family phage prohead protease [Flavobacterium sp.]